METGNPTLNQKVFITLRGYTALVNEYHRTIQESKKETLNRNIWIARRDAFEYIFRELELPIDKLR